MNYISSLLKEQQKETMRGYLKLWVQLSHPYMTTGKTIALTRRIFAGKGMSLLLNMLSRLVITFGFPCGSAGKESACKAGRLGFDP